MSSFASPIAIHSIATAVPQYRADQAAVGAWVADSLDADAGLRRYLRRLYELSGIESRYSCLPDAQALERDSRFAPGRSRAASPTTAERMAIYERESVKLGTQAAQRALAETNRPAAAAQITHLIVVSCTGFFAPGLDLAIARNLGLQPTVQRSLIGFMGCAAAFNGLRLAAQIVAGQPTAQVLVVCVELCTLHLQPGTDRVNLTVASLFGDGAAACVVGAPQAGGSVLMLNNFFTGVKADTHDAMAWQIGDHGFEMRLSPQVPRHVGAVAAPALAQLLDGRPRPQFWALHPGGRAILDRLRDVFDLNDQQMAANYHVLRHYGNMSSPTILFVLNEHFKQLRNLAREEPCDGIAVAFGPGLVTEMAHLTYMPEIVLEIPQSSAVGVSWDGRHVA